MTFLTVYSALISIPCNALLCSLYRIFANYDFGKRLLKSVNIISVSHLIYKLFVAATYGVLHQARSGTDRAIEA